MLKRVRVSGFSLLRNADLELGPGMTVITGESGAGKSLLLDAVSFALGARPTRSLLASGASSCEVELVIELDSKRARQLGQPWAVGENTVQRRYSSSGRSVAKINGVTTTLQELKDQAGALIEISGQFESRVLFNPHSHLEILDRFGDKKLVDARAEYQDVYSRLKEAQAKLKAIRETAASREQEIDFLTFQAEELGKANVEPGEKQQTESELRTAENAGQIVSDALGAAALLTGGEDADSQSAYSLLAEARNNVESLERLLGGPETADSAATELLERLDSLLAEMDDCSSELTSLGGTVSADPAQIATLRARLDAIHMLERKYGVEADDLQTLLAEKQQRLEWLTDAGQSPEELERSVSGLQSKAVEAGRELVKQRKRAAKTMIERVTAVLKQLDFAEVQLLVEAEELSEPGPAGLENVEFLVVLNPGEPARPLAMVASGGEASRLMLGLKAAMADKLGYIAVFLDEIEAGLGGKAADSLAAVLAEMSSDRQVIAVTHLPLVAARGNVHLRVDKELGRDGASSVIGAIDGEVRRTELARMLGNEGGEEERALVDKLIQSAS